RAHNPKVVGSNPAPATKHRKGHSINGWPFSYALEKANSHLTKAAREQCENCFTVGQAPVTHGAQALEWRELFFPQGLVL
ncbi:hypothetical protein, partial [Pseudomonas coleopterorum]|uniref:hypothetical protein n=1 Tax=Pseudomonas coleopterorum TaxID=1605838 RepID=UPI0028A5C4E8